MRRFVGWSLAMLMALLLAAIALVYIWVLRSSSAAGAVVARPADPVSPRPAGILLATGPTAPVSSHLAAFSLAAPQDNDLGPLGLIGRELIRQSFLMRARDDLGLDTWDEALGEQAAASIPVLKLAISSRGTLSIVVRQTMPIGKDLLTAEMDYPAPRPFSPVASIHPTLPCPTVRATFASRVPAYLTLIAALDTFERAGFAGVLPAADSVGPAQAACPSLPGLGDIDLELQRMDLFAQLGALRRLHQLLRSQGQTPPLLGRLARGYANASVLSLHLWNDGTKVYAARALLYAERCVSSTSASAWALRQRAYVRELVGFIDQGRQDLDRADAEPVVASDEASPWVTSLRQYAAFDYNSLAAESSPSVLELSHLLGVIAAFACEENEVLLSNGYAALNQSPACFRLLDVLAQDDGVGNLQRICAYWPTAMQAALAQELAGLPGLPPAVGQVLSNGTDLAHRRELVAALRQPESRPDGVPGLGAYAQAIEDDTLDQALWLTYTQTHVLGEAADLGDFQDAVYDHPYRNLVLVSTIASGQDPERVRRMLLSVPYRNFRPDMSRADVDLFNSDPTAADRIWEVGLARGDPDFWDALGGLRMDNHRLRESISDMLAVATDCPLVATMRINRDPQISASDVASYRTRFGSYPGVRAALGHHLMDRKQWAQAEADFRVAIQSAPEQDTYEGLAQCRLNQGDEDGWLATLKQYLATDEKSGLSHDWVLDEIANHYMATLDFETAWPYARDAAASGAGWAMQTDALCAEGRNDLVTAAGMWKDDANRYDDDADVWLKFIQRTGADQQDLDAAKALAMGQIANLSGNPSPSPDDLQSAAMRAMLVGDRTQARDLFQRSFAQSAVPFDGLFCALLSRADGDLVDTRSALARIQVAGRNFPYDDRPTTYLVDFSAVLAGSWASSPAAPLDVAALKKELQDCPTEVAQDINLAFFMATALDEDGRSDDARYFYRHAAQGLAVQKYTLVYSCMRLRELGEDPWPLHRAVLSKPPAGDAADRM